MDLTERFPLRYSLPAAFLLGVVLALLLLR